LAFLFQPLETVGGLMDRSYIFLEDDLLSWCSTDHFREPPEMGRATWGPTRLTDLRSEYEGFEPELGGLEVAEGIFTGPRESPHGFIFDLGDIDRSEIPRARQAGQLPGGPL
jgi:hypothetical protein